LTGPAGAARIEDLERLVRKLIAEQGEPALDEQGNLIEGSKKLPWEYWDYVLSIRMLRKAIDSGDKPAILDASYNFGCASMILAGIVPWKFHKDAKAALMREVGESRQGRGSTEGADLGHQGPCRGCEAEPRHKHAIRKNHSRCGMRATRCRPGRERLAEHRGLGQGHPRDPPRKKTQGAFLKNGTRVKVHSSRMRLTSSLG
jgi:hypothetical protein